MTASRLACASLLGCAEMLGVDNYSEQRNGAQHVEQDASPSVSHRDAGSSSTPPGRLDAGGTFPEQPPAYSAPACVACIDVGCDAQRSACEADAYCASYLEKARSLPSRDYPSREQLSSVMNAQWRSDHGEQSGAELLSNFQACVRRRCTDPCQLGRDFACVGNFEWPASYPMHSEVRFRVIDFAGGRVGVDGLRFRACPLNGDCASPLADVKSGDGGFVVLPVDFTGGPRLAAFPEFNGYWLIDGRDEYPIFKLQSTRPYVDHDYAILPLFNRSTAVFTDISGSSDSAATGTLIVAPYDCRDEPAKHVVIDVWRPFPDGFRLCSDCGTVFYSTDNNLPDPSLTEFATQGVNALLHIKPDAIGDLAVVVRDATTRAPIAMLDRLGVRANEFLVVSVYPASKSQLSKIPQSVR